VPLGERLLEDRRIGRHPRQRILTDAAGEITVAKDRAVDEVEPDGLAGVVEPLKAILRHLSQVTGKQASQRNISRYRVARIVRGSGRGTGWPAQHGGRSGSRGEPVIARRGGDAGRTTRNGGVPGRGLALGRARHATHQLP